ncbi:MAG: hypothetical protein QOE70_717 [Chthoniobacter sp.]|jgi:hypothetical protein|nr:hypothetical protein [Chthoniobacter sp.]
MFPDVPIARLVADGLIAAHPVQARTRIMERYGCELTVLGLECSAIRTLRDLVESLDDRGRFARCLVLCASHTHWGDRAIVESYDRVREVFLNGPVAASGDLTPMSFVFTEGGPIPFEWCDQTVSFDPGSLNSIFEFIVRLNDLVVSTFRSELPIPIGISIDHRFKNTIWDDQIFGYAEGAQDEEDGRAVVRPILDSVLSPYVDDPEQVQVTWTCFPNHRLNQLELKDDDHTTLSKLEAHLATLKPSETVVFVNELETALRQRAASEL